MKSSEVRIGNYYLEFGVELKQVEFLRKDTVIIDFNPIPLTEEWLLKFGFELLCRKSTNGFKNTIFSMRNPSWSLMELDKGYGVNFWQGNNLLYVHQLQNLYFALTGEELTIKDHENIIVDIKQEKQ